MYWEGTIKKYVMEQHIRHESRGYQELKRIFQHASLFIEPDAKLAHSGDFLFLILLQLFVRIANKMSYKTPSQMHMHLYI